MMPDFSILQYISELGVNLAELPRRRVAAFSAWCSQALMDQYCDAIRARIGDDCAVLGHLLGHVWERIDNVEGIDEPLLRRSEGICMQSRWEENAGHVCQAFEEFGSVETLECLLRMTRVIQGGDVRWASECAERVLNVIDFEVSMVLGQKETYVHPKFIREIERQNEMLKWLASVDKVESVHKRLFRAPVGVKATL